MPPSIPGWSTLDAALAAWWAVEDRVPILLVGTLHISWLALSYRLLLPRELAAVLALIALEAAVVCLSALRPAAYLRHRLPLVAGIRALSGAFPLLVDVSRLAGRAAAGCADVPGGGAGACAAPEEAGDASSLLRALGLLLLPVAWLHSCLLAPISIHLPPLAHVVVHTATVVLLMRRATTGGRQAGRRAGGAAGHACAPPVWGALLACLPSGCSARLAAWQRQGAGACCSGGSTPVAFLGAGLAAQALAAGACSSATDAALAACHPCRSLPAVRRPAPRQCAAGWRRALGDEAGGLAAVPGDARAPGGGGGRRWRRAAVHRRRLGPAGERCRRAGPRFDLRPRASRARCPSPCPCLYAMLAQAQPLHATRCLRKEVD